MIRIERRFLFGAVVAGAAFLVGGVRAVKAEEASEAGLSEKERLQKHMEALFGEKESVLDAVWQYRLMVGERGLSREQIYIDLRKYFDIYKAAEIKYNVPWFLLWHTHIKETTSSRDPNPNGRYKGAMQRDPLIYSDAYVNNAAFGWEFLGRVASGYGNYFHIATHDYQEIFGAARKICEDAQGMYGRGFLNLTYHERTSVLQRYCSPDDAVNRATVCRQIAPFFGVSLRE